MYCGESPMMCDSFWAIAFRSASGSALPFVSAGKYSFQANARA